MREGGMRLGLTVLILGGATLPAAAGDGLELGFFAGVTRFERGLTRDGAKIEPTVGLRAAWPLTRHLSWFIDGTCAVTQTGQSGNATAYFARTGVEYGFRLRPRSRWFLAGAGGHLWIDFDRGADYHNGMYSISLGQELRLHADRGPRLRWEMRSDICVNRGGWDQTINDGKLLAGLTWSVHARHDRP